MDEAARGAGFTITDAHAPGSPMSPELVPWLIGSNMPDELASEDGALTEGTAIVELVAISLFSDARAEDEDELLESLDGPLDRRGWWAERLLDDSANDRFGSRLWLLTRAKETDETRALARDYAEEAHRWLVDDGLAERVDVELYDTTKAGAGLFVRVVRGDGRNVELRYPSVWRTIESGID